MWGVSLTHPVLTFYVESFSYPSRADFLCEEKVSLIEIIVGSFSCIARLLLYVGSFYYTVTEVLFCSACTRQQETCHVFLENKSWQNLVQSVCSMLLLSTAENPAKRQV